MRTTARLVRALLFVAGGALTANAAWLAVTANLTLGTAMVAVLGLGCLACGIWFRRLTRHRVIGAVALLLVLAIVGLSSFLANYGTNDNAHYDEDAVVVLGAAVHGRELSNTLVGRLDAALAYHRRNPSALIVVSGGQGLQEEIPEAVAMRQYLLDHGVADDSILVEDRSTSTEENFANTRALLNQRLTPGYRIAFITDEFHVYRAGRIAAAAGFAATHASSRTPWYFWPANYLRESVAVLLNWLGP
ncbi:MAG TPA: YdcF family protein [Propionicimonas sp.]|uniref:YdcF family protein n=1 Tax=Propionicimonas sp. TaxID=1955623 RepID=UPI002F3EFBC3